MIRAHSPSTLEKSWSLVLRRHFGVKKLFQGARWWQEKGKMLVALGVQTLALHELREKGKLLISSEKTSRTGARPGVGLTIEMNLIHSY